MLCFTSPTMKRFPSAPSTTERGENGVLRVVDVLILVHEHMRQPRAPFKPPRVIPQETQRHCSKSAKSTPPSSRLAR